MKILYYQDGSILAIGDISETNGIYQISNDISDVNDYTLSGFGLDVYLDDLTIELPENFQKWQYKYINNNFVEVEQ